MMRAPLAQRFEEKCIPEPNTGCHLWIGAVNSHGYGKIVVDGGVRASHRISYELSHGPIPTDMEVCHRCDNPCCVNPAHLFLGTHADNMGDCVNKGRFARPPQPSTECRARGERQGSAKLTASQVGQILDLLDAGERQVVIAARFGVGQAEISRIKRGTKWAHIPHPGNRS